jgi:hypothetical protein
VAATIGSDGLDLRAGRLGAENWGAGSASGARCGVFLASAIFSARANIFQLANPVKFPTILCLFVGILGMMALASRGFVGDVYFRTVFISLFFTEVELYWFDGWVHINFTNTLDYK